MATIANLNKRLKNHKSSIQPFRLSVALAKKYTSLITIEQTFKTVSANVLTMIFVLFVLEYYGKSTHLSHFERSQLITQLALYINL